MWVPDPINEIQEYFIAILVLSTLAFIALRLRRALRMHRILQHRRTPVRARNKTLPAPVPPSVTGKVQPNPSQEHNEEPATGKEIAEANLDIADEDPAESRKSDVEFYVLFPHEASNSAPFSVYVCVANYRSLEINANEAPAESDASTESFVAEVPLNGRIGVNLRSNILEIDAPYQALIWRDRDAVAAFIMHSTTTDEKDISKNTAWITINGIETGKIDFQVVIDPKLQATTTSSTLIVDQSEQTTRVISQQRFGILSSEGSTAHVIRKVFICHSHADHKQVSEFGRRLESVGVHVLIDVLDMRVNLESELPPEKSWLDEMERLIGLADIAYVCWSKTAQSSKAVALELEAIRKRLEMSRESGGFHVFVHRLDRTPIPRQLGWLLREALYPSKRWDAYDAYWT